MSQQPPPVGPQDGPRPSPPYPQQLAYSPCAVETYAVWGRRVGAFLLDSLLQLPGWLLAVIGFVMLGAGSGSRTRAANTAASGIGVVLVLVGYAVIGIAIWNRSVRAGRTGQSWGKKVLGIRLVRQLDGRPIGGWLAFGRDLVVLAR